MHRRDKLGEGTYGIVYSATSPNTNREYAIKRNLVEKATSFIGVPREVDVLNKLRTHPHIVRLESVAFGHPFKETCFSPLMTNDRINQRDDGIHFVFGQATYDLHRFIYGALETNFWLNKRYMLQILLGVEYIHGSRMIHRDLKPNNILIFGSDKDVMGVNNVAKICDFGLAKPYTYQGFQTPGTVASWYRAPEIALGYPHYDYKSDVWSLGCILFEMIARKPFIPDVPDDNDRIISQILGTLPEPISRKFYREHIKLNKWRDKSNPIKLSPMHNPKVRKTFIQQLGFTNGLINKFEKEAGSLSSFCDLLNNMLQFDWNHRYTITECIDHPFFEEYKDLIRDTRKKNPPRPNPEQILVITQCIERKWMSDIAVEIFNNRGKLFWYNTRALFQAMDLFDRYLAVMFSITKIQANAVESEYKGLLHDKFGTELRFMTCLYLCIKYFSSIHHAIPFDAIVSPQYKTKESLLIAEQFESSFVKNCLEYDIYRPTIYEAADEFSYKLADEDIRDLIVLYSMNNSHSGMTPTELFNYYKTHLQGSTIDKLLNPINKT